MPTHPKDPGSVADAHLKAEFVDRDLEAAMATMGENPWLTHVPVMTGGYGAEQVREFYKSHFIGHWPADTAIRPISRTVGQGRIVLEFVVSFTHDVPMPAILPGIAPTGRPVVLPHVVIMGVEEGRVLYEHIYWDQASLLVQTGLLDPSGLPVTGSEQAARLLDPTRPSNTLIPDASG